MFVLKDKWSAITHFIGFILSIFSFPFLLSKASYDNIDYHYTIALSIFLLTMIILYGASSAYHAFNISPKVNLILKRIDHCSVFLLIAGTYTPVYIIGLGNTKSMILLILVWILTILGIIFKICWVTCPKWVSSVMYIALGWIAIFNIKDVYLSLTTTQFILLLLGGIFYTIGGVIYSLKLKIFKNEEKTGFGNHELFHIFILFGTLCHYVLCLILI